MDMNEPLRFQAVPKPKIRAIGLMVMQTTVTSPHIRGVDWCIKVFMWKWKFHWHYTRAIFPADKRKH